MAQIEPLDAPPVEPPTKLTTIDASLAARNTSQMPATPAVVSPEPATTTTTTTTKSPPSRRTPKDFIFGKLIGEGSFSTVYLAKDIHTEREYAIKVCEKRHILREKKQSYVKQEKEVLFILNQHPSPFFVSLFCTFQDAERLYFVLTYAKCGELLPYINKNGSFDEECSRFYAAEVVLALEHLHRLGIIHRDLKPENILLSEQMHILVTDFGSAKIIRDTNLPDKSAALTRKNSFVGTAQYVSPELLTDKCASKSSDLWAFGCIIYQMISGLPPFRARNEYLIFQKIIKLEYEFPDGFYAKAKDLVKQLLVLDPSQRLGMEDKDGYQSIKAHTFFKAFEWSDVHLRPPPPIYPYLPSTPGNEELRSHYRVIQTAGSCMEMPINVEPGLDDKQVTRLLGLDLHEDTDRRSSILNISPKEYDERLAAQARDSQWHKFVQGNLILKQGFIDKRKGLFAKRRMLLLTTGPHLYYVDAVNMILKGEIPWSPELKPESKSFKIFFVHTTNRTYYLEDPEGYALEWCRIIDEVRKHTYRHCD